MFVAAIRMFVSLLLGEHVVTSLVGIVCAMLTAGAVYVGTLHGQGWYLVALGMVAAGRVLHDWWKTKDPTLQVVKPADPPQDPPKA